MESVLSAELLLTLKQSPALLGDRYRDGQLLFRACSNQQNLILNWLKNKLSQRSSSDELTFLSIGAGTGIFDGEIVQFLAAAGFQVNYEGVEPNPSVAQCLRDKLAAMQNQMVQSQVIEGTFEQYQTEQKFEVILLLHTHYFFRDAAAMLQKAQRLLSPNGKLYLFTAPEQALSEFFKVTFQHNFGHAPLLSDDLETLLNKMALSYEKNKLMAQLDIALLENGTPEEAQNLANFIIHADATEYPETRVQLLEFLRPEIIPTQDKILVPHTVDVIELQGTSNNSA